MSDNPWYTQIFNPDLLDNEGWWTIKNDGSLVRRTLEDIKKEVENCTESKKNKSYKWKEVLDGYEIALETPGIEDFDYFKFENEKLLLRYNRMLYGKRWVFNESLELPISTNRIDAVDYESNSGVTKINLITKPTEKSIKIVNRNKMDKEAIEIIEHIVK